MALKEAAGDSFQAREENDTETQGKGDFCYEPAESNINESDKLSKKGGAIKQKGTRLNYIWVQYLLSPLQHLHMSSGHTMLKERNSFWAKIKPRVLSGKHGLKVKPVDCKTLH